MHRSISSIYLIAEGFRIPDTDLFKRNLVKMKSNNLVDQLKLRRLDEDHFIGGNYDIGTRAIFGGHVLAQAVLARSEEHTSELQSRGHLVCRLLLEKKNK